MNILIVDKFEQFAIDELSRSSGQLVYEPTAGADGLPVAIDRAKPEILIVRSTKVQRPTLAAARGLRLIIRAGAGVDNIDMAAATELGISVCNCPGMNAIAVAELAMGLLLSCDRRIPDQTADLKAGKWSKKVYAAGARGLKGSTLGVVGLGAIGEAVVRRALAFEMNIIGWSRSFTATSARSLGIRFGGNSRASLLAFLPECDAVSVHVALAPETRHLCNADFFAAMKSGACFINTSRGAVVDEASLLAAASARGLRCGLDVFEAQPATAQADFSAPITRLPGCAFTHHTGASTEQAQTAVAQEVLRIVKQFKETGRVENCVNAEPSQAVVPARSVVDVKTTAAGSSSPASPSVSR